MSADKHPSKAEVFAGWLDGRVHLHQRDRDAIAAELRRLSAIESERDQLHAEVMEQARLLGMSGERELALRAEIERLRKDAERQLDALRVAVVALAGASEDHPEFQKPYKVISEAIDAARKQQ